MKNKKLIISILLILVCAFAFTACSTGKSDNSLIVSPGSNDESGDSISKSVVGAQTTNRLIVYTYDCSIVVDDAEATADSIVQKALQDGGYLSYRREYSESQISLTLKVPADKAEALLSYIEGLGEMKSKTVTSTDITEQVEGIEEKIAKLNAQLQRYLGIDTSNLSFSERMELEDRIAEVKGQIDYYEAKSESLKAQVNYSTMTVTVSTKYTYREDTFAQQIKDIFSGSWESVGSFFKFIVKAVVAIFPYALIIGVIITVIVIVRKKKGLEISPKKIREQKRAKRMEDLYLLRNSHSLPVRNAAQKTNAAESPKKTADDKNQKPEIKD